MVTLGEFLDERYGPFESDNGDSIPVKDGTMEQVPHNDEESEESDNGDSIPVKDGTMEQVPHNDEESDGDDFQDDTDGPPPLNLRRREPTDYREESSSEEEGSDEEEEGWREEEKRRNIRMYHESQDRSNNRKSVLDRKKTKKTTVPARSEEKDADGKPKDWKTVARDRMNDQSSHLDDSMTVFVACTTIQNMTAWQRNFSMLFLFCSIQKIHPFETFTGLNGRRNQIALQELRDNDWIPPRCPNMENHLKVMMEEAHSMIEEAWNKKTRVVSDRHRYENMDVVRFGGCPPFKKFKEQVAFGRRMMHRIWYAYPGSEDDDVRNGVVAWMMRTLTNAKSNSDLELLVDQYVNRGIIQKLLKSGQTIVPSHLTAEPKSKAKRKHSLSVDEPPTKKPKLGQSEVIPCNDGKELPATETESCDDNTKETSNDNGVVTPATETESSDDNTKESSTEADGGPDGTLPTQTSDEDNNVATAGETNHVHETTDTTPDSENENNPTMVPTVTATPVRARTSVQVTPGTVNRTSIETTKTTVTKQLLIVTDELHDPQESSVAVANPDSKGAIEDRNNTQVTLKTVNTSNLERKPESKQCMPSSKPSLDPLNSMGSPKKFSKSVNAEDEAFLSIMNHLCQADPTLGHFLRVYMNTLREEKQESLMAYAIRGCLRDNMKDIWLDHHRVDGVDYNLTPPQCKGKNTAEYDAPGEHFVTMAKDVMHILNIFLNSCDHQGIEIDRWHWEFLMLQEMNLLGDEDHDTKNLAILVCLILSAATNDLSCISATIELHKAGYLSLEKLAKADWTELYVYTKQTGIGERRATYLIQAAQKILKEHKGRIPTTYAEIEAILGIGRKTGVLYLNEALGIFYGIGADKHVIQISYALGLFLRPKWHTGKKIDADHVENSLREWIEKCHFKRTNPLFGAFAQLMTQMLNTINTTQEKMNVRKMMVAMRDHIHRPYHVEMLWFIITRVRTHYTVNNLNIDKAH